MPEISLITEMPRGLVILFVLCAGVVSWWYYRKTIPPLPRRQRYILIALRWCALSMLFLLLAQPLLTLLWHRVLPHSLVLLIDNSKSMTLVDGKGRRDELVRSFISRKEWNALRKNVEVRPFIFDRKLKRIEYPALDSLKFDGDETNIAGAFQELATVMNDQTVLGVVLVSDGNSTTSVSPLYDVLNLGVPLYTIGVGDTAVQRDIAVQKIRTNEVCYAYSRVPLYVTLRCTGYNDGRVTLQLKSDSGIVATETVTIRDNEEIYHVPMYYKPTREGMNTYEVTVSSLPGEITLQNNCSSFSVRVLRSKRSIILVAGSPSPDVAFFRRSLEQDTLLTVHLIVQRSNGTVSPQLKPETITEADCIVFIGYPTSITSMEQLRMLKSQLATVPKPVLWIMSRTVAYDKLQELLQFLPLDVQSTTSSELQVFPSIPQGMELHPIVKLKNEQDPRQVWDELPPYFTAPLTVTVKNGASVLAESKVRWSTFQPFIVVRTVGNRKTCAVLGYGLWRWKMLTDAEKPVGEVYDSFVHSLLQWLTTVDDEQRIRVQPVKHRFSTGEKVEFEAHVYDETYRTIDNAEILVTAQRGAEAYECVLSPIGNGQYEGSFDQLPAGNYSFRARITVRTVVLATTSGTFTVGESNEEFLDVTMNKHLLQFLAERSGGAFVPIQNASDLFPMLEKRSHGKQPIKEEILELDLRNTLWMFGFVVLIFTCEWFLRKRYGLL